MRAKLQTYTINYELAPYGRTFAPDALAKLQIGLVAYSLQGSLSFNQLAHKISRLVGEAASKGAQLVMLPELIVMDLGDNTQPEGSLGPQIHDCASYWPDFIALNQSLAAQHQLIIYSGTFPRRDGSKVHNTGALVFPDGQYFLQDKLFITPTERRWEISPGSKINVVQTVWGNWVNLICYDCEIPEFSSLLAKVKPTLILVPSMTEGAPGYHRVRWLAQARAIEHKAFVVNAGMVDGPKLWPNYGQCSAIGPYDKIMHGLIAESPLNTAGVFHAELNFEKLNLSRLSDSVYPGRDQNAAIERD